MAQKLNFASAFGSFSVDNIDQAEKFYRDTLGLKVEKNEMGFLNIDITKGNQVMIYPKEDHQPATFTILNFLVEDLEKTVDNLSRAGITFEHYEGRMATDEKGIWRTDKGLKTAWFKDPAGNFIALIEPGEFMN